MLNIKIVGFWMVTFLAAFFASNSYPIDLLMPYFEVYLPHMAQERKLGEVTHEHFEELKKKLGYVPNMPYMSLELGEKYPRIFIAEFKGEYYVKAEIPAPNDPGYEVNRPVELDELMTFVRVAKSVAPDFFMTKALETEAIKMLIMRSDEINSERNSIGAAIRELTSD